MSPLTRAIGLPINGTSPYPDPAIEPLSEREREVLHWLASGASNREISQNLYITESTVKRHVYHIFGKLNVRNRTQATLQAIKLGVSFSPENPSRFIATNRSGNEMNKL
jgi:DNA-binding NarL/FixJ family response regulator